MDPEYWKNIFDIPPPLIRERIKNLEILFILPDGNLDLLRPPFIVNILLTIILVYFKIIKY